eukprot:294527_1
MSNSLTLINALIDVFKVDIPGMVIEENLDATDAHIPLTLPVDADLLLSSDSDDTKTPPISTPKIKWIDHHSHWLNEAHCDDELQIFDEPNQEWCIGTITNIDYELRDPTIDITLHVRYTAQSTDIDESIAVAFEQPLIHKLKPKYRMKL